MPVDWTALTAVVLGTLIVLIPVAGLTARFALQPIAEAFIRAQEARGSQEQLRMLEERLHLLERHQDRMEDTVERLEKVVEFHDRLESGGRPPAPSE